MADSKNIPAEEIPEVKNFLEAEDDLKNLKEEYPGVFDELKELLDRRNAALEAAEKAVRARNVSCGPFTHLSTSVKYDAEKLYDALGRDEFLKVGGSIETIPTYSVDKKRLQAAITLAQIPPAVLPTFVSVTNAFSVPKKILPP